MNNKLISKIFWNKHHEASKNKCSFFFKNIMLLIERSQIYKFDNIAYKYNADKRILTAILGHFTNFNELKLKYGND